MSVLPVQFIFARMDAFEQLKAEALAKRDRTIATAKAECSETLRVLRSIRGKLRQAKPTRSMVPLVKSGDLSDASAVVAAEAVLHERGPLTLIEIVAEILARGCRPGDKPRKLAENLRSGFKYHAERFTRNEGDLWSVSR